MQSFQSSLQEGDCARLSVSFCLSQMTASDVIMSIWETLVVCARFFRVPSLIPHTVHIPAFLVL